MGCWTGVDGEFPKNWLSGSRAKDSLSSFLVIEDISGEVGSLIDGIFMVFFYIAVGLILSFRDFIWR